MEVEATPVSIDVPKDPVVALPAPPRFFTRAGLEVVPPSWARKGLGNPEAEAIKKRRNDAMATKPLHPRLRTASTPFRWG